MRWWAASSHTRTRQCVPSFQSLFRRIPKKKSDGQTGAASFLNAMYRIHVLSFDSFLVGWSSWSRKGCNFPTYLPTGSAGVLVGVPHSVALWWFFPPPLLKTYLVYHILADLENKVPRPRWPNFFQPNPTLCLSPQQTSAPPHRALGHAIQSFQRPYRKKWLDINYIFVKDYKGVGPSTVLTPIIVEYIKKNLDITRLGYFFAPKREPKLFGFKYMIEREIKKILTFVIR